MFPRSYYSPMQSKNLVNPAPAGTIKVFSTPLIKFDTRQKLHIVVKSELTAKHILFL